MDGNLYLYVYVYVDGWFDPASPAIREEIFRRELPLALEAIQYGDRYLYYFYMNQKHFDVNYVSKNLMT